MSFNVKVNRREALTILGGACLGGGCARAILGEAGVNDPANSRIRALARGPVRFDNHCFVDHAGPFLGLGVSYFTALWRLRNDRARLRSDLEFLSNAGFDYVRMLSMVGYYPAWAGQEIAPVRFTTRAGESVEAWGDYWELLQQLVDVVHDEFRMRTQITIFADAQLMQEAEARLNHLRTLLERVVRGREHKLILLEVANEAWQNGFSGDAGLQELREFTELLNSRTKVLVATTSNHDLPSGFERTYRESTADAATWHFSRDRGHDGWGPVYDCWELGERPGYPPVISNEPIGPGSSVRSESDPLRLVMAAAYAYAAKLPSYVFHSEAGVFGRARFQATPGIDQFRNLRRLLPSDLPNWARNDGLGPSAPLTVFASGRPDTYAPEASLANDGCVRNCGATKAGRFVCLPIGIRAAGLEVQARRRLTITVHDPLTGELVMRATLDGGEKRRLPSAPEALVIRGRFC